MSGNYTKLDGKTAKVSFCSRFSGKCFNIRKLFLVPVIVLIIFGTYYYFDFDYVPFSSFYGIQSIVSQKSKLGFKGPLEDEDLPLNIDSNGQTILTYNLNRQHYDTVKIFPTFNFSDFEWTNAKDYFWNNFFEDRFTNEEKRHPLKIIVIPHSHNDPGWGWTYEEYFRDKTQNIINLAVDKLVEYPKMTFQWSEASFMDIWWLNATEKRKSQLKTLIQEKRFEIVTGGWVMTDEAVVPLYSMIDQLIEGQHWFKYHLDVSPKISWSVDPFGFGSTFPYLLKISGMDSMIILRIHYAWKKWMAENQLGDFYWLQRWDDSKRHKMLCHQAFYTMYLIANSLGPHSDVCRKFDFISEKGSFISPGNIESMAQSFVGEAGRTASLFKHNVAMPILGADFTFRFKNDWDTTYKSYMQLFDYINSNKDKFNSAEVKFGTISEYFDVVRERQQGVFPSIVGDFFPYSDTQSIPLNRTAYWSGFYASRPFWKKMHRETENNVRTAEILFTLANRFSQDGSDNTYSLSMNYPLLVNARQYLALFAHHDAAPGVSAARVMIDYERKLNTAIENSFRVQITALEKILSHLGLNSVKLWPWHKLSDPVKMYKEWRDKVFDIEKGETVQILLLNSLGREREEYVKLQVNTPNVGVVDDNGNFIKSQLNPVITFSPLNDATKISDSTFELVFIAKVPAVSIPTIFTIQRLPNDSSSKAELSKIATNMLDRMGNIFEKSEFNTDSSDKTELYFLENDQLKLGFAKDTGFLKLMDNKLGSLKINMTFGGYVSVANNSGPYLFMADENAEEIKVPFLNQSKPEIFVVSGPVSSEIIVAQHPVQLSIRILQSGSEEDQNSVFIENQFDSKKAAGEFFMRFDTNMQTKSKIESGKSSGVFYTDQSGFAFEKRIKVDSIGVEGNYYPVTTMAFMQDEETGKRLSLLVDRSHGAASLSSGSLEVMIERRLLQDDHRGIGQGIMDNRRTTSNYILKFEQMSLENDEEYDEENSKEVFPSFSYHRQSQSLNYPLSIFVIESAELIDTSKINSFKLFSQDLPGNTIFLNLRTLPEFPEPESTLSKTFSESYSSSALMIFHKPAYTDTCYNPENCEPELEKVGSRSQRLFLSDTKFHDDFSPKTIERTDLTGLRKFSDIFPGVAVRFENLDNIYCDTNEISSFKLIF